MAEQDHRIEINDEIWLVKFQRGTHALTFNLLEQENYRGEEDFVQIADGRLTWQGKLAIRFYDEIEFSGPDPFITTVLKEIWALGPQHITNWDPQS